VLRAFGPGALLSDGELDRERLAGVVFGDAAARRRLNAATHLPVLLQIVRQVLAHWARCRPVVVSCEARARSSPRGAGRRAGRLPCAPALPASPPP
jgi:dephospho-CoA kinase